MEACKVANRAASSAIDSLINGSITALQSVRDCEEKLDDLDHELDQQLASAITRVTPMQARELLACMKLMLDLERVGDLIASFAERASIVKHRLDMDDVAHLTKMACLLENMLDQMTLSFKERNVELAIRVLRSDWKLTACAIFWSCGTRKTPQRSADKRACMCLPWPLRLSAQATM